MANSTVIDYDAWHDHASWWEQEAPQARHKLSTNEATLTQARAAFGKIGSSTVGAGLADVLKARHEAGERLGDYADRVAGKIRTSLDAYGGAEQQNSKQLKTDVPGSSGSGGSSGGVQSAAYGTTGPVPQQPVLNDPVIPAQPGGATPQYPPYIPETQANLTSGMPFSTIEGIHGDQGVVLWKPTPEQPLPPYWMHSYEEISPGVWIPDRRPSPPGATYPQ